MMDRPAIAVLIACHNRRAKTLACLASLGEQTAAAAFHPIVFDDGSTDGTAEALRRDFPGVEILAGGGTAFWAGGMRTAFDHALERDFDFYLWLNDDVVLQSDAVARLLAAYRERTEAGDRIVLLGGAVADPATRQFAYGGIDRRSPRWAPLRFRSVEPHPSRPQSCDTLNGNVLLIPRVTAQAVGSIGRPFIHDLADLDYGRRVGKAGGWVGLAAGYVGHCASNPGAQRWFDPSMPLAVRWRLLREPLGFPLRPWLHFARTHGGPLWPVFAAMPFWRLVVPGRVSRFVRRARRLHARIA